MTFRLILSIPVGSSVDTLSGEQRAAVKIVNGRWTPGGMPGTTPAGGRYLIDVLTDVQVTRKLLDQLGLPLWLILGCWEWDGAAAMVVVIGPLDALYGSYLPEGSASEPHRWAGWPGCIGVTA